MSETENWSPDEPLETETFEAWDEALDDEDARAPGEPGGPEGERSLDEQLIVDDAEVDELGLNLDDPERLAVLDGGADDPDGVDTADLPPAVRPDEQGWDLDAAERRGGPPGTEE
jgi:hypothetical protein